MKKIYGDRLRGALRTPPRLPEHAVYRAYRALKRQPRWVQIGVLGFCCLVAATGVILSYASLFRAHPDNSHLVKHHASKSNTSSTKDSASTGKTAQSSASSAASTTAAQAGSSAKAQQTAASVFPADILNLTNWKLTLPIGQTDHPYEIVQPQLASYALMPYFRVNTAGDGVQFEAQVGGVTTSGSKFPRSELREMTSNGRSEASWSTTSGTSVMNVREAINHLPVARPQLVAAQIHGSSDYVILIRLNGSDLFVENDGDNVGDLDTNYKLGTAYDLRITASNGRIQVSYNGVQKVDIVNSSSGDYFKAGCYIQSNASYGDNSSAYGETTIYNVSVSHT